MKISETTKEKVQKNSQIIFCVLAWTLLISIIIQVSFAALAVFVNDDMWEKHLAFVRVIEYLPAVMYIFGSAGWVPQKYRAWSMMLFILFNLQYYTTNGWMGIIHAVLALAIFSISCYVAWGAYKFVLSTRKRERIQV
ncbi:DUF6220 domain-containing protein [Robertmurraya massiliosenegalensis]|uniref:DUF6220 domain-containing protein n=1 Tax=Robertmurraya TaxID=2837507 RepID=UPI0039A5643D